MHVNNCFWTFSTERYWKSADVIESVMYFAVPCFFMISGANLMDYRKRYDTKTFLIKRTKKTIIPYIFWSLFGIGFGIWMNTLRWEDVTIKYVSQWFDKWRSLVTNFWFFIPLYTVYLSITVIFSSRRRKT
ncbi:MAG: acyltransferase family protein [Coprococcus sp.]